MLSCTSRVRLGPSQSLLNKNKITLKGFNNKNNNELELKSELSTLYKQKPNRNWLLFVDREKIYSYLEKNNSKKIIARKTLEKQAEPPAILDTSLVRATKINMHNFMFNKGFFNVKIDHKIKTKNNSSVVNYIVNPGREFMIDSLIYVIDDTSILNIILEHKKEAILTQGAVLDNFLFQSEKARITDLLNNHGYAEFAPIYIQNLDLDTLSGKNIVKLKINNPDKNNLHNRYTIGIINVFTNYNPSQIEETSLEIINNKNFYNSSSPYYIKNKILEERILLNTGSSFRKSSLDSTYIQISNLEYYKFVNIESKIDSFNKDLINHSIYLTPNYKFLRDIGTDINYTTLKRYSVSTLSSLMGISSFFSIKNRNLSHSGSSFETKLEIGAELNFFSGYRIFNALNVNFINSLQFPSFKDITRTFAITQGVTRVLNKKINNPICKTALNLGFEYVQLTNLFQYFSFNNNLSYNIPLTKNKNLNISTIDFSIYLPSTKPAFDSILKNNEFLKNTITQDRIFTSFFLSHVQFFSKRRINSNWSKSYLGVFEASGIEASILDGISQLTFKSKLTGKNAFLFSKFIKYESDHRWERKLPERSKLVFRINYGIAIPFLKSNPIPYIRQFYMGGPQSMRGWRLRELGPGADTRSVNSLTGNYYSSGDLKMEFNIEYRFKIYWKFEGAIFTDIGNLWQLPNPKIVDKKAEFAFNSFYKQIAGSTGLGLRMDFDFFLIRLDYGMKWRNPYPDDSGYYGIYTKNKITPKLIGQNSAWHLALNYPF